MLGLSRLFFRKARHTLAKKPKQCRKKQIPPLSTLALQGFFMFVTYLRSTQTHSSVTGL